MGKVNVLKRGNVYQYKFEIAPVDGKRKFKNKSGFLTKNEAMKEGIKAYTEYMNTGHAFTPNEISYSDYLDYWMKEHCEVNLKYHTTDAPYREIRKKVEDRKKAGCICVEMECSALAAVAKFRKKEIFQFFYAADNLDSAKWDKRSLGNEDLLSDKEKIGLLAIKFASSITDK